MVAGAVPAGVTQMWRRMLELVMLGTAGAVLGAATSVNLSSGTLGAARAATPRCTNAALTVFQNLSAGTVASVTVGGLPVGCGGATLQVTVSNGATSGSGSISVPAGGGSVTVVLGSAPLVAAAERTDLVVIGP